MEFPTKNGWYWVLLKDYDEPTPCWYGDEEKTNSGDKCFLPAGLGDSSSTGIYEDDIERIGPEIIVPHF